jgi:hypothetical protein
VRKCIAALVAIAVCTLQAQAMSFHVHAAADHSERAGHAHGPAIHQHHHQRDQSSPSSSRVRLTADDEGSGAITLLVPAGTMAHAVAFSAVPAEMLSFDLAELTSRIADVEFRSHGPPVLWRPSFRGPPALLSI